MRCVDSEWLGVRAHCLQLCRDSRELCASFHDAERGIGGDIARHGYGLIGRAVPAHGRRLRTLSATRLESIGDVGCGNLEHLRQARDHISAVIGLATKYGAIDSDHERGAIGDKRPTGLVEDQTAHGRIHNLAHGVVLCRRAVLGAFHDLQVEKPGDQGAQEGCHEHAQHEQAQVRTRVHLPPAPSPTEAGLLSRRLHPRWGQPTPATTVRRTRRFGRIRGLISHSDRVKSL